MDRCCEPQFSRLKTASLRLLLLSLIIIVDLYVVEITIFLYLIVSLALDKNFIYDKQELYTCIICVYDGCIYVLYIYLLVFPSRSQNL